MSSHGRLGTNLLLVSHGDRRAVLELVDISGTVAIKMFENLAQHNRPMWQSLQRRASYIPSRLCTYRLGLSCAAGMRRASYLNSTTSTKRRSESLTCETCHGLLNAKLHPMRTSQICCTSSSAQAPWLRFANVREFSLVCGLTSPQSFR
eukprot:5683065-Amphidinium_carterae.1